jgi:hypothetical protein
VLGAPAGLHREQPAGLPKLANQTWARSDRDNPCSWAIRSRVESRVSEQSVSRKVRRSGGRRSRSGPGQVAGFVLRSWSVCESSNGAERRSLESTGSRRHPSFTMTTTGAGCSSIAGDARSTELAQSCFGHRPSTRGVTRGRSGPFRGEHMILSSVVVPLLAGLFLLTMERLEARALPPRDPHPIRPGPHEPPDAERAVAARGAAAIPGGGDGLPTDGCESGFDCGRVVRPLDSAMTALHPTASWSAQSGGQPLIPHQHGREPVNHRSASAIEGPGTWTYP